MTSFDGFISALEAEASLDDAWLSLEPVFSPHDGHYQIQGSRDGLLLLAAAAIEASRGEDLRIDTSRLFIEDGLLDERVLYITGPSDDGTPRKREPSESVGVFGSLSTALYLLAVLCAAVGLWEILGVLLDLTGLGA